MPKLTQDFNISPYYDDFDEENKFYKVLYRPGYSVQARELNQIQSILQTQLEKTGDTLYQDGSRVLGSELILNNKNRFKNWKCKIGQDLVVIKDKKVYLSNACNTHKTLGDIQNFKLLDKPIICEYDECTCGSDIEITKWKM